MSMTKVKSRLVLIGLICSLFLVGCSQPTILYIISPTDIFQVKQGSRVIEPNGFQRTSDKHGWFISDLYLGEVVKAKVSK